MHRYRFRNKEASLLSPNVDLLYCRPISPADGQDCRKTHLLLIYPLNGAMTGMEIQEYCTSTLVNVIWKRPVVRTSG